MATAQGALITTDGGKFRLKVDYSYTTTAIKFKPYVVVTDAFTKEHTANVEWVTTAGKWSKDHKKKVKATGTYYIPDKKYKTNGDYQIQIRAIVNGKTSQVTLTSNLKPAKPTVTPTYVNDAHINVKITGKGAKAVPNNTVTLQRQDDITSDDWETLVTYSPNTTGAYSYTFADQTAERGHRYRYRAATSNQAGSSGYTATDFIYTNPPEVSNVAHVRNSNYKNTISWERDIQYVDRLLITSYRIERSVNGGAWTTAGTKAADKTAALIERYEDTATGPNNYYSYRVKPVNSRGVSPIAYEEGGTDPTYNTPAAPQSVAAAYDTANNIVLTLVNNEVTATGLTVERSVDGGSTWVLVEDLEQTDPITTYTDDSGVTGTNIQYRVRNTRADDLTGDDRYSPWTLSNTVRALSAPNPPTLILPVDGTPVLIDQATVRLGWVHNPTDGTAQTAAQIEVTAGDSTRTIQISDGTQYYDLSLSNMSAGDVVSWRVKTKGAYYYYGAFCEAGNFTVKARPDIHFTAPNNGDVITNLPIELAWTYGANSGLLQALTLEVLQSGQVVYTADVPVGTGEPGQYTYSLAGYLFDNDTSYGLRVTALADNGLTAIDEIGISIEYVSVRLQDSFFIDPEIDDDTGIVRLLVSVDESPVVVDPDPDAEEPEYIDSPVDHATLYRVVNNHRVLLQDNVQAGDEFTDMYAPLNMTYQYELVEVATTGEVALIDMDVTIDSEYWYIYWGADNGNIARVHWAPNGSVSLSRPEKELIRYSGRKYPVSYDSKAIEETYSYSGIVTDDEVDQLDALRRMVQDGGQGIWKSCDGCVYKAGFEYNYSSDYTQDRIRWDISLNVTRVDSEEL